MSNVIDLHARHRAYLNAVAAGRAEMTCSCEPDLFIDGLACCDQYSAHQLADAALITPSHADRHGSRVPAALTEAGATALAA